ncbi:MAG: terminase gpA endonuclease subunit [Syntrophorhabdaceae bacterium]
MAKNNLAPWWPEERKAWEPPEDLSVSEWADKYRILTFKAAKNGPWETSFNPVMRSVMDCFSADGIKEIWMQTPAQCGKTDSILNMLGWAITEDPGTTLIVEPTEDLAIELSTDRIDDMVQHCDHLMEMVVNERDDLLSKKKNFSTMTVYFGWAGSAISLASRTVRYVFFDEVNKYGKWTGEEANPLALGVERTATFEDMARIVYCSTPTTEEGYITKGESACDVRFRYHIACPECGHKQTLNLEQVKFGDDHTPKVVEDMAWYECEKCASKIYDDQRMELVRRGEWIDDISGLSFDECMAKIRPKSVGFQFNRLYTPWFSFGKVAAQFLRTHAIPEDFMNFVNSWLGQAWQEKAESKTVHQLAKNRIDLPGLICPADTVALTCGIDPGQGGYWYTVLAWLKPMTPHVVHYGFAASQEEISSLIHENGYQVAGSDRILTVWRGGMDTGGSKYDKDDMTMTEKAYMWIRLHGGGKVVGTKGASSTSKSGYKITKKPLDKTPKGKPMPKGLSLWILDTAKFKDAIHMRLALEEGQPGRLTFHADCKNDIFSHISAEEKIQTRKGEYEWRAKGANHLFDCLVIAFALADPEANGGVSVLRSVQAVGQVHSGRRVRSSGIEI